MPTFIASRQGLGVIDNLRLQQHLSLEIYTFDRSDNEFAPRRLMPISLSLRIKSNMTKNLNIVSREHAKAELNNEAGPSDLLDPSIYDAIREAASGNRPLLDFQELVRFSGFSPSAGADQVANSIAAMAHKIGLSDVRVERFPSNGMSYNWAFRLEPYWEGQKAILRTTGSHSEVLADFAIHRTHLARFSRSASLVAELVDVGAGVSPQDYDGKSVEGKLVLARGPASIVMRRAVWERGAAGVVAFRTRDGLEAPDQIAIEQLVPWLGPNGEAPTFAFSISFRAGMALAARLAAGEPLDLSVEIEADTGEGAYPVVLAEIPGSEPLLPHILFCAHSNSRNTGGANNLTGVGCTLEVARALNTLIVAGEIARPRRTIRFLWGAEHYAVLAYFKAHPEDIERTLTMLNVDMIGYHQERTGAVLNLYRSPHSNPSFVDDVMEAFVDKMGRENSIALRNMDYLSGRGDGFLNPLFSPGGTRAPFRYSIQPFWGPSDHEDVQALGISSIMLNDFPASTLGTQEDTVAAVDPTQMRRGVVISAASAYFLASAGPVQAESLTANAAGRALKRIADDRVRALDAVYRAGPTAIAAAREHALSILKCGLVREKHSLSNLSRLIGESDDLRSIQADYLDELEAVSARAEALIEKAAARRAQECGLTVAPGTEASEPPPFDARVPERDPAIQGPVNLSRYEYGRWWLQDKTGDEGFMSRVKLHARGGYMAFEALNFADGRRTVAQIAELLSVEFTPVAAQEVSDYFSFLETCDVVRMV